MIFVNLIFSSNFSHGDPATNYKTSKSTIERENYTAIPDHPLDVQRASSGASGYGILTSTLLNNLRMHLFEIFFF